MTTQERVERGALLRAFFAQIVTAKAGVRQAMPALVAAFAKIERERFLGPGPWRIFTADGYVDTPSDDPAFVYQDMAIGLVRDRPINNGEPSLHARALAALDLKAGERVLHVGTGSGYYTAILAELVGATGHIEGREIEPDLVGRATENLRERANVAIVARSGLDAPLPASDAIYVNAGASRPVAAWLDALKAGGRLIFPLTAGLGAGVMLKIVRSEAAEAMAVSIVSPAAFIPCSGGQDEGEGMRLMEALRRGDVRRVRSLRRGDEPDETCWLAGTGWWFSTREA